MHAADLTVASPDLSVRIGYCDICDSVGCIANLDPEGPPCTLFRSKSSVHSLAEVSARTGRAECVRVSERERHTQEI